VVLHEVEQEPNEPTPLAPSMAGGLRLFVSVRSYESLPARSRTARRNIDGCALRVVSPEYLSFPQIDEHADA